MLAMLISIVSLCRIVHINREPAFEDFWAGYLFDSFISSILLEWVSGGYSSVGSSVR